MIALAICALAGWIFAGYALWSGRQDAAAYRADARLTNTEHQATLADYRLREQQLLDQVQLNAQHLPYYPTMGPAEPVPDRRYVASEDGLIVFEDFDAEIDAAMREVADL